VHVRRLRVFAKRVLRRIFEARREEITRDSRQFGNEDFHNIYTSPYPGGMTGTRVMR
jgi:hypothetical protein